MVSDNFNAHQLQACDAHQLNMHLWRYLQSSSPTKNLTTIATVRMCCRLLVRSKNVAALQKI